MKKATKDDWGIDPNTKIEFNPEDLEIGSAQSDENIKAKLKRLKEEEEELTSNK